MLTKNAAGENKYYYSSILENPQNNNVKKILVAEDDDDDFDIFNSALHAISGPVEILRTKNGIMLSSLIETSIKPDIIILDLNMPFKSGTLCLQEIKSKPQFNSIKVVIYSTSSSSRDIDECYNLGASFYLVKPVNFSSTIRQFDELFNNPYFKKNITPPRDQFVLSDTNKFYNFISIVEN